jgi:hypothetical protein
MTAGLDSVMGGQKGGLGGLGGQGNPLEGIMGGDFLKIYLDYRKPPALRINQEHRARKIQGCRNVKICLGLINLTNSRIFQN